MATRSDASGRLVVVALRGGLGNQLFQFAAAAGCCMDFGGHVAMHHLGAGHDAAECDLATFLEGAMPPRIRLPWAAMEEEGRIPRPLRALASPLVRRQRRWSRVVTVAPPGPFSPAQLDEAEITSARRVYMTGFFQHPSWFERSLRLVVHELLVRRPRWAAELLDSADAPDLAVHVRAGDYAEIGWELAGEYYVNVAERAADQGARTFLIAADDVHAAGRVAKILIARGMRQVACPGEAREPQELRDFWMLASSTNVAMANSTFSWWATVVGDAAVRSNRPGVVWTPDPWLPGALPFPCYQSGWNRVSSGFRALSDAPR
jgi:hypothetical protein